MVPPRSMVMGTYPLSSITGTPTVSGVTRAGDPTAQQAIGDLVSSRTIIAPEDQPIQQLQPNLVEQQFSPALSTPHLADSR